MSNTAKDNLRMADQLRGIKEKASGDDSGKKSTLPVRGQTFIKKPKLMEDDSEIWLLSYADMMTLLVGFFAMILSFSKIDPTEYEKMKKSATQMFGGEYKIPHEVLSKNLKEVLKKENLSDMVVINQDDKGVEVTFRGALFFDSGSAVLKTQAFELFQKIIPILQVNAKGYSMVIEGHTDDSPIKSPQFPSNWELSSFRAAAVLRLLEDSGFDKSFLKAVGWGETRPILPNRSPAGTALLENQGQNRRVVLKILKGDDLKD